ncbi:hypothetical protein SUDANB176_04741 [Streptomyces sp. enrichment culture]|uniref:hypothetical protein n=1 Tax=Streptomyces sp. enrichment culture TaxID=1795815 RepID=UPI003F543B6A
MQTTAPIAEGPKASPVKVTLAVVLHVLAFALLGLSWMATYEADHPGAFPGRPDESDIDFGVRLFALSFLAETGAALALRKVRAMLIVSGVYLALAVYRIIMIYPHLYVL